MSGIEAEPDAIGIIERLGRKALADACGIKRTSIAQWVYNETIPDRHLDSLMRLARENGVDPGEYGFTEGDRNEQ